MPNLFHKYQQPIWIVLTLVVIATFVLFWNGSMITHGVLGGSGKVASIYGQPISDTDFVRDAHKFQIAVALEMTPLIGPLAGNAQSRDEELQNFIFNTYVFDHEAALLQVFPTDAEVQDELARVPGFQTDGRFDPAKLTDFVQNKLPSLGFTDSVIDELVRREVQVRKVAELIGSTVNLSTAELHNRFVEESEKMDIAVIRLSASDLARSIPVSDADAEKEYNAHAEDYRSDEQRQVNVASFELTPDQEKLTGKDRTDALQKVGNNAWAFAQAVVDKSANFAEQAKQFGVTVTTSAPFTASQPDPALSKITALSTNAFKLSTDYPTSDVIEGQNGYYVLHLAGNVPSRQLSFPEAKPQVVAQIQKNRAGQLMQTKANTVRDQITAALKAGKSIDEAAAAAGLKAEIIPPFSLQTASKVDVPDFQGIVQSAVALGDKQMSDFSSNEAGGFFVYMDRREPVDKEEEAAGEAVEKAEIEKEQQAGAFVEWLRLRKEQARLQFVQRTS